MYSNTAINDNGNKAANNDTSDSHDSNRNGDHKIYFWKEVRGTLFKKYMSDAYKNLYFGSETCLRSQVLRRGKGMSKK